jgi:hypothetical protein
MACFQNLSPNCREKIYCPEKKEGGNKNYSDPEVFNDNFFG